MKKLNQLFKIVLLSFVLFLPNVSLKAQLDDYYSALLVGATDTGSKAEKLIIARLEKIGFSVTYKGQSVVVDNDAKSSDLVIISATVTSSTVSTALPSLPTFAKPVIIWEPFLYDFMGFQAADGGEFTKDSIKIIKNDHPLAAKLALGTIKMNSTSKGYSWGKPEGNPIVIATNPGDTSQKIIFAYEKDAKMGGTNYAPARRVGFFFLNDAEDTSLNKAGWSLFDAAVYWSINNYPAGISTNKVSEVKSSNFPNPFKLSTDISFNVPSKSYVRLSIYNILGEKISTLTQGMRASGNYKVTFNPADIPGGIYFYKLEVGSNSVTKKMIYVK